MSIENTLERIATALETLANATTVTPAPAVPQAAVAAPVAAAPVVVPMGEAFTPPFAAPAPAPSPSTGAPFNDVKGLTSYCMDKYRTLGPVKGGMIQGILQELGAQSIHQLAAEKYGEFYAKVEVL